MGAPLKRTASVALAAVLAGYVTVVLGGYVSSIGAGLACPDWPTCHGEWVPSLADPGVAAEYLHRLAAFVTGLLTLATLVLVWWRHRSRRPLLTAATASFGLLTVQVLLGMLAITTALHPLVVTAHLALATAFMILMTVTVLLAFLGMRAAPAAAVEPRAETAP